MEEHITNFRQNDRIKYLHTFNFLYFILLFLFYNSNQLCYLDLSFENRIPHLLSCNILIKLILVLKFNNYKIWCRRHNERLFLHRTTNMPKGINWLWLWHTYRLPFIKHWHLFDQIFNFSYSTAKKVTAYNYSRHLVEHHTKKSMLRYQYVFLGE